ncbi:hypothetical protein ILUMI_00044, partial [Ignelater luminosus]
MMLRVLNVQYLEVILDSRLSLITTPPEKHNKQGYKNWALSSKIFNSRDKRDGGYTRYPTLNVNWPDDSSVSFQFFCMNPLCGEFTNYWDLIHIKSIIGENQKQRGMVQKRKKEEVKNRYRWPNTTEKSDKGKQVQAGYGKITIDGIIWRWNKTKDKLEQVNKNCKMEYRRTKQKGDELRTDINSEIAEILHFAPFPKESSTHELEYPKEHNRRDCPEVRFVRG